MKQPWMAFDEPKKYFKVLVFTMQNSLLGQVDIPKSH